MLSQPNLDDRTYQHMVENSLQLIRKYCPGWTDENPHDPGITIIEMLCWLLEMQQYYINQISDKHHLKFLKLLGVRLQDIQPAVTEIIIEEFRELNVPLGTPLLVYNKDKMKPISFELIESAHFQPFRIDEVWVWKEGQDGAQATNHTKANQEEYVYFYPFGERNHYQHTCYFSLQSTIGTPTAPNEIMLTVWLDQRERRDRHSIMNSFVPPVNLQWEYAEKHKSDGSIQWLPLQVIKDETFHLSYSGRMHFRTSVPMKKLEMFSSGEKKYWFRCRLTEGYFDHTPQIDRISINVFTVKQWKTFCHYETFSGSGQSNQTIIMEDYLSSLERGQVLLQVKDKEKKEVTERGNLWRDWHFSREEKIITFSQDKQFPLEGTDNIRVIYYSNDMEHILDTDLQSYGVTTGLPHQRIIVPEFLIPDQLHIQIKEHGDLDLWEDWTRVEDLEQSSDQDAHYMYMPEINAIQFGDDVNGRVPGKGIVRIITLRTTDGEEGNIASGTELEFTNQPQLPKAKSPFGATQGKGREQVIDAMEKLKMEIEETTRAVTQQDYENIALRTPGIRVGKVEVMYSPMNTITIAVSPMTDREEVGHVPIPPSQGFLHTVANHLEPYRLVTTRLKVIQPTYIQVTVYATVLIYEQYGRGEDIPLEINMELYRHLHPHADSNGNQGWTFGNRVRKKEIIGLMYDLSGVAKVQDVWIQASGDGIAILENGDIEMPWNGLVYSGEHQIRMLTFDE